jgi:hypothetical protein
VSSSSGLLKELKAGSALSVLRIRESGSAATACYLSTRVRLAKIKYIGCLKATLSYQLFLGVAWSPSVSVVKRSL